MPAVGTNNNLTAEEITAIMNHEKSSWGNNAKPVTVDEVKKVVDFLKITSNSK
jgi:cytochrome c oxidase cbb3-type subunit 2